MYEAQELEMMDNVQMRKGPQTSQIETNGSYDRDRDELARLGKKQVLKRRFGFMSMLGFSCTIMVTWEGMLVLFLSGFTNGGPAGLVYGYIVVWLGTAALFVTLAELASMAPTSGGQYHWVYMLAPPSSRKFLSYVTGWQTVTGWQAFVASGGYLTGTIIQGLIALNHPDYNFQRWHGTLLFWAIVFLAVLVNTVISRALPKIEGFILVIHILGFFALLIPLVYLGPHGTATDVFTLFLNEGGWPTQGLSFCVGIIGNVFAFLGADGAVHMSEEIHNASTIVPRSMMTSIMLNGALGFGMLIATLFCLGDIQAALKTSTGYPFIEIFYQATGSVGGSTAMASVISVLGLCATIGFLASSSRLTWAFARDRGLPGWRLLSKVEPRSSLPLWSVAVTTTVACLLGLINIGSSTAFNAVISLTINGLFASYFIASGLLLWRRIRGDIKDPHDALHALSATSAPTADVHLTWGPWRVPGVLGTTVNVIGCAFMVFVLFFSFWPPITPTTAPTMNFSVLVSGTVFIFSVVYYYVWARKFYTGPIVEIEMGK